MKWGLRLQVFMTELLKDAANMALLANPQATLDDLLVYVIHTGKIKPMGTMFPTCPHCAYILENFNILSNLLP